MAPVELVRFASQRRELRDTSGLRFARALGVTNGLSMSLSVDVRRWALFTVWDDLDDLDAFEASSPLPRHWRRFGAETYALALAPISAHGQWGGETPLVVPRSEAADSSGPIAVLTRVTIAWRRLRAFHRAVPPVDAVLADRPGLLASIGIGEAPISRQGTFSLWASELDLQSFAYGHRAHREVIRATRRGGWYREELFARFRPVRSSGAWDGRDPLADQSI